MQGYRYQLRDIEQLLTEKDEDIIDVLDISSVPNQAGNGKPVKLVSEVSEKIVDVIR